MPLFEDNDIEIFSSREQIRNKIIEFAQEYLELQSVDLQKTSFVSYIINVLSILSANQMFYSSSIYREFFLTKAVLQESVHNLAKWIGYTIPQATPSSINVLFTLPLSFTDPDITFSIPDGFQVKAGDIPFTVGGKFTFESATSTSTELQTEIDDMLTQGLTVKILNNRLVTIRDNRQIFFPTQLDITDPEAPITSFLVPFTQVDNQFTTFPIPSDLEFYQFFSRRLTDLNGQISSAILYVIPPTATPSDDAFGNPRSIQDIDTIEDFNDAFTAAEKASFLWTESAEGIFTLGQSDKKYVLNSLENEVEISFGNGIIGFQPAPGSIVAAILSVTKGEDGNVIPGSITTGDSLFYETSVSGPNPGQIQRIQYDVTNTFPAAGGTNIPTLSEIKSAAITNLRSKGRLVSGLDYEDFNIIASDVPLEGSIPILKRSDLKVNEISLFSQLIYNNPNNADGQPEIVPTRNIRFPLDGTNTFHVLRGSSPTGENSDFETIFNMEIDTDTSSVSYDYSLKNTNLTAANESTNENYNPLAFITIPNIDFSSTVNPTNPDISDVVIEANVNHIPTVGITSFRANVIADYETVGDEHLMVTELDPSDSSVVQKFTYTYDDILDFRKGEIKFTIQIQGLVPWANITTQDKIDLGITAGPFTPVWFTISVFSASLIVRRDLSDFMISSLTLENGIYIIHNVPVIQSEYLAQTNFPTDDFELNVIQKFISNIDIANKKMITDFINLKFPDTAGKLTNMKYNPRADIPVISRSLLVIPQPSELLINDSFIINGSEGTDLEGNIWANFKNYIARWNGVRFNFIKPRVNDFVQMNNPLDPLDPDDDKRLIFTEADCEWRDIEEEFTIPFRIVLEVNKDPLATITSAGLVSNIKSALITHFAPEFGMDKDIDRSEISQVVRSVEGVTFVRLIEPRVDIRFRYKIEDLPLTELLDYTPQLVAFTEDTITVSVLS